MTTNPTPDYTAEVAERTVEVRWPDNDRRGATPPRDGWQDHAFDSQPTLHEVDEGSISGCSLLRWRRDPRPDAELVALSLALVTGKPPSAVVVVAVPPTGQTASTAPLAAGLPLVQGRCPACGTAGLFLGDGGYVTCSLIDCPEPDAASTVLEPAVVSAVPPQPEETSRG
jgi:hypothetical protein